MNRTGAVLFVALLVASAVVAAVVVHARTPDLELQVTGFTTEICPQGSRSDCERAAKRQHPNRSRPVHRRARIRFFVRESDPHATVEIVGPNLQRIRRLFAGPLAADKPVSFVWNGRDAAGNVVSSRDRYRLRVILPSRDRDMVYPRRIQVFSGGTGR
jgi:hypothetical protein